jgi:hypothetical protein
MAVEVFGIRHHGPGSARSLRRVLAALEPDLLLVEGPPDADAQIAILADPSMRPPVALLVYVPDEPQRAVAYPMASFSPEYQALCYALERGVPARFMDLPHSHQLAITDDRETPTDVAPDNPAIDPLSWLAHADGHSDGERWWELMVEQRREDRDLFKAILEAMSAVRAEAPEPTLREVRREAWMRQTIRTAERQGFERIAVVCGAWHAPALLDLRNARVDAALLKGLPRCKTTATWTPWTYGRLTMASGYGAGVVSPGWYDHLWKMAQAEGSPGEVAQQWLVQVARLLRREGFDASPAHAIEAARLAETLAILRGRALPGLDEMNEVCRAVFTFGDDRPMGLIQRRLIVSERLGAVPDTAPMVPLQQDLQHEQRRLRLPPTAVERELDLDLRKPLDRERGTLLRRMGLLGLAWGRLRGQSGTGTFREHWLVQWQPEFAVSLIEAAVWGNTVVEAATARARSDAEHAPDLSALTAIAIQGLLADLPDLVGPLLQLLQARSAHAGDVVELADALIVEDPQTRSSLVRILRYGDVREIDAAMVAQVINGLVLRVCVGLANACASLDADAATAMEERISRVDAALRILDRSHHLQAWYTALRRVADLPGGHGLVAGRCCRLLLDAGVLDAEAVGLRLRHMLARAEAPARGAAFVEGLLKGSGLILLHDPILWQVIDDWVAQIGPEAFVEALPLLRRTFATFAAGERRRIGERVMRGEILHGGATPDLVDPQRADMVLAVVAELLGVGQLQGPELRSGT